MLAISGMRTGFLVAASEDTRTVRRLASLLDLASANKQKALLMETHVLFELGPRSWTVPFRTQQHLLILLNLEELHAMQES